MKTKRTTKSITEIMMNIIPTMPEPGSPPYGVPQMFDQLVHIRINRPIIPRMTANTIITTILIFPYPIEVIFTSYEWDITILFPYDILNYYP